VRTDSPGRKTDSAAALAATATLRAPQVCPMSGCESGFDRDDPGRSSKGAPPDTRGDEPVRDQARARHRRHPVSRSRWRGRAKLPPPNRPLSRRGQCGFLRDRAIYPDTCGNACMEAAEWRLPVHQSKSPTAIPRRAAPQHSPLLPHQSQPRSCDPVSRWSYLPPTGCHLDFARRVTFLPCADRSTPAVAP
jgi:hypothetical protein